MLFDLPAPPTPRHSSNLTGLKQLIFETMVATPGKLEEMQQQQQQQRAAQWPRYPDSPVSKVETIGEMLSDAASDVPSQHDWLEDTIVHRSDRNEIDEQLDNEIDAMDMTNGEETSGPVNDAHSKKGSSSASRDASLRQLTLGHRTDPVPERARERPTGFAARCGIDPACVPPVGVEIW